MNSTLGVNPRITCINLRRHSSVSCKVGAILASEPALSLAISSLRTFAVVAQASARGIIHVKSSSLSSCIISITLLQAKRHLSRDAPRSGGTLYSTAESACACVFEYAKRSLVDSGDLCLMKSEAFSKVGMESMNDVTAVSMMWNSSQISLGWSDWKSSTNRVALCRSVVLLSDIANMLSK